jgi:hypothetical protein
VTLLPDNMVVLSQKTAKQIDAVVDAPTSGRCHNPWFLSSIFCGLILLAFGFTEPLGGDEFLHWSLIPLTLCGIIIGVDAIRWFTGEVDTFDPAGLLGLFGVYFFFLAPLLHVRWNEWIDEVLPPPDWRLWLGAMACVNVVGLLAYRVALSHVDAGTATMTKAATAWHLRPQRLWWVLALGMAPAVALQVWVYARFGGLSGYMVATEHREQAFLGIDRIGMLAGSVPVQLLLAYAVVAALRRKTPSWPTLYVVLLAFAVLKLLFGGLQGSRAEIVWAMFAAVGMVHFWIRPFSPRAIVAGALALVLFMYIYGFYKSAGVDGLQKALESSQARASVEGKIRRPIASTLLADLGRSDVQAYMLYRLNQPDCDYRYAYGRTYLGAVLTLVPGPLWRERPPTKVKEGTDVLHGAGSFRERPISSTFERDRYVGMTSRVFGLAGEAMLNFGPWSVPIVMALFGFLVGHVRRWLVTWRRYDARRLLLPWAVTLLFVVLVSDSDNVVWFAEHIAAVPFVLVYVVCTTRRRAAAPAMGRAAAGASPLVLEATT